MKYIAFWVAGKRDGETLATFDNELDAIKFANDFYSKNEDFFDPCFGGVEIVDEEGNHLEW